MNKLEQKVRSNKTAKQKKTKKLQTTTNHTTQEDRVATWSGSSKGSPSLDTEILR